MAYLHLFLMFFRIGVFNFGGGLAMLPLIFQSVHDFGIMSSSEFSDLVALSQVTPGPIAVNAATYVGFDYAGIAGAAVATLGVSVPSFVIMMIVAKFIEKYDRSKLLKGAFFGIRPVTVGLIASAVIFVSEGVLFSGHIISAEIFQKGFEYINLIPSALFVISLVMALILKMKPIQLMIIMGVAGALLCG